jgi:hypothetical protein
MSLEGKKEKEKFIAALWMGIRKDIDSFLDFWGAFDNFHDNHETAA